MNTIQDPHQSVQPLTGGLPLNQAKAAMILIHGRGSTAEEILRLSKSLYHPDFVYFAPQAVGNTWYPNSFLAPIPSNEPGISLGIKVIKDLVTQIVVAGIPLEKIVLGGFSQGACLASEFIARNAERYGGLVVFSGGLIGPPGTPRNYAGSLSETPVFLGCSNVDFHIPLERVNETADVFEKMGAKVNKQIYPNMGHTIIQDEIDNAIIIIRGVGNPQPDGNA